MIYQLIVQRRKVVTTKDLKNKVNINSSHRSIQTHQNARFEVWYIIHHRQIWRTTPSSPVTSCMQGRLVKPRSFVLTMLPQKSLALCFVGDLVCFFSHRVYCYCPHQPNVDNLPNPGATQSCPILNPGESILCSTPREATDRSQVLKSFGEQAALPHQIFLRVPHSPETNHGCRENSQKLKRS